MRLISVNPLIRSISFYIFLLPTTIGCSDKQETIEGTGIRGQVHVANVVCSDSSTVIGEELYNGFLYFMEQKDVQQHFQGADASATDVIFSHLKGHSFTVWVGYGQLDATVPVGTYVVATRDLLDLAPDFVIEIEPGVMLSKDLTFTSCVES